uniref:Uncharacterized protein n=1 Tax=Marmota marmota marmota TaxID=9994 RepID=A0A8C6A2C4_MARMA
MIMHLPTIFTNLPGVSFLLHVILHCCLSINHPEKQEMWTALSLPRFQDIV